MCTAKKTVKIYTVKRPNNIMLKKLQIFPLALTHSAWTISTATSLSKKHSVAIESVHAARPKGYSHFCEQDVIWSFYIVDNRKFTDKSVANSLCFINGSRDLESLSQLGDETTILLGILCGPKINTSFRNTEV